MHLRDREPARGYLQHRSVTAERDIRRTALHTVSISPVQDKPDDEAEVRTDLRELGRPHAQPGDRNHP